MKKVVSVILITSALCGCEHFNRESPKEVPVTDLSVSLMDDVSWLIQRSEELLNQGEVDQATELLQRAYRLAPQNRAVKQLMKKHGVPILQDDHFVYQVQPGESLSHIAGRFLGDVRKFDELARLNDIDDPTRIEPGQKIKIPRTDRALAALDKLKSRPVTAPANPQSPKKVETSQQNPDRMQQIESAVARKQFAHALQLVGEDVPEHPKLRAYWMDVQLLYANSLADQELWSQAISHLATRQQLALSEPEQQRFDTSIRQLKVDQAIANAKSALAKNQRQQAFEFLTVARSADAKMASSSNAYQQVSQPLAEEWHEQAVVMYRNQQLDEAIELWDKVLVLAPSHERAQVFRARAQELKQRLEKL